MNTQQIIRLGNAHLRKKYLGHVRIKMLSGVENHFRDRFLVVGAHGPRNHGRLDELGASADDGENFYLIHFILFI
jgi:hypothetical protein